jgi:uncharacterized coiled-coil DUF342 family protein
LKDIDKLEEKKEERPIKATPRVLTIPYSNIGSFASDEAEQLDTRDIFRALGSAYEPIDESNVRIIDFVQRAKRAPQWQNELLSSIAELRKSVSDIKQKLENITEDLEDYSKTYNATIYDLNNPKYSLTIPIQAVIIEDEDDTVARIPELNLYATGDTDSEAIYELKQELVQLYEELNSAESKLGPLPESWLNTINKLIVRTDG